MSPLGPSSTAAEVIEHLRGLRSEDNRQGMKRYGIRVEHALGISHGVQRKIAKTIKRNHERAFELWDCGIAEARFIASLTADPKEFTAFDARNWAAEFDSWDIVDGVSDFFVETEAWHYLILEFADDEREFVRRTAFAMMAWASVHRKSEPDTTFLGFLPIIETHSTDNRNFVWKAVSWALRSIGKRSTDLNTATIGLSEKLSLSQNTTARRIGRGARKELSSEKTQAAMARREENRARKQRPA
jgi:3-methyladenine DNA glycosylase AlkD